MVFISTLDGNWEKLIAFNHVNLTILMFLFMVCVFEVVLLKLTLTGSSIINVYRRSEADDDDSSEYEEDIYYEDLRNNSARWTRRQMLYRQQLQHREQEMLSQFRMQRQQRIQQVEGIC